MYLFIDTETGGLTPQHSLLTVSAIVADRDFKPFRGGSPEDTLYLEVRHDEYVVTPEALSINKIDLITHSARGLKIEQARERFTSFLDAALRLSGCGRLIPAGHNALFDMRALWQHLLPETQWRKYCTAPVLDTAVIAQFFNAVNVIDCKCNLVALREFFGIDTGGAHHAEVDNKACMALARHYAAMMREFLTHPIQGQSGT